MDIQTYPTTSAPPPPKGNPYTSRLVPAALCGFLLIAYLCPWTIGPDDIFLSGFNVWQSITTGKVLWFLPILVLYCSYTIYTKRGFVFAAILTGLFPFGYLAYLYVNGGDRFLSRVSFGWWAAIFIGFLLAAAGARATALAVFIIKREKKVEVLDHFYIPIDQFNMSSREFYEAVQRELIARQVPGLTAAFLHYHEGSIISAKRTYLRLTRGQLVFDICAAPFGRCYFFSSRFCAVPVSIHPVEIFLGLLGLFVGFAALANRFGLFTGSLLLALSVVLLYGSMRHLIGWLNDKFDLEFPEVPIFGALYARFHKETYYEFDTKLMYQTVVPEVVRHLAGRYTAQKGIQRLEEYRRVPGLTDLYEPHFHLLKPCPPPSKTTSTPSSTTGNGEAAARS